MKYAESFIRINLSIIIVSLVYLILNLTNLTLLPIFNDESIYLDWAWSHTHMQGHLYDSLLDAKQPGMIWLFGFFENIFSDPLFAGRFVSVLFGLGTMLGIYILTKKIINKQTALIAAIIYSITPIFVFYNRQALMEASIACIGIWSCVMLINLLRKPTTTTSILLGALLGFGFFIKSSSLLFIIPGIVILSFYIFFSRSTKLIKPFFTVLVAFFCVDFLLFINPVFWETFSTNSRYSFTFTELLSFPIKSWWNNLSGFFEIGFVFITPLIFLTSCIGMYLMMKKYSRNSKIFFFFFFFALVLEIISAKFQGQRYLVSFLPFLVIPAAFIFYLMWKDALWKKGVVVIVTMFSFLVSLFQITNPEAYVLQLGRFSAYADTGHARGQTSGHGINDALHYMLQQSNGKPSMVLFGFTIGNPESTIDLYAQRSPNLAPMHIDAQMFTDIPNYDCLTSQYPVFLVTRMDQQLGMAKFFELAKSFPNPDNSYSVRIYTLKKNCKGKTTSLSNIYLPTMNKIFQMKKGIY